MGLTKPLVVDLVVERDQEAVVALSLDMRFLKAVDLGILVGPVLVDQGCLSLNLGQGLAWMLLPDAVVLGQVFLRCPGVLRFRFVLSVGDFVDSVMGFPLHYLIHIIRNLGLGLGLEVGLALVVGLPSLLERLGWGWMRLLMALQDLWRSVLVCFLKAKWLQSVVSRSHQETALGLSTNNGGYQYLQGRGRPRVISALPKIKGCT